MRTAASVALLGVVFVALGAGMAPARPASPLDAIDRSLHPVSPTATPDGNASLLTMAELSETVDEEPNATSASLYYAAANGTWYHAKPDGSVGAPAPEGPIVPNIQVVLENGTTVNETVDIPASDRPVYVWKATRDGCGTTVYDASSGEGIAAFPIPECGRPTSAETARTTARSPADVGEMSPDEPDTPPIGRTPGFGIVAALVGVLVTVLGASQWADP